MENLVSLAKRALSASALATAVAMNLTSCGGGDSGGAVTGAVANNAVVPSAVTTAQIVPPGSTFRGQTYAEWAAAFWQWALALPLAPLQHPFAACNSTDRPISADQTGSVWFWSAPDTIGSCNQSAVVIPAGKAVFLTMLDVEASSLDDPPFRATTYAGQKAIAEKFASRIGDLFCFIDGQQVPNITAYFAETQQFHFHAPSPWIFETQGGNGTSVGAGYFLMLQLPPGTHTIRYGGVFHLQANDLYPGSSPLDIQKDITLTVTMGG
ncbi:hypothetical protein AB4Y40_25410 [Paraburkholderia sp. EG287B]|uniref:hypothetical protein n=1 Tax=Paraburkholderia sp. EG287B TaxID=3237010 RepID=UPI0034D220D8